MKGRVCYVQALCSNPEAPHLYPFGQLGSESLMRPSIHSNISNFSKKVVTGRPELPAYDSVPSGSTDIELPFGN